MMIKNFKVMRLLKINNNKFYELLHIKKLLMGVIPAQVAGVKKIYATVPCPNNEIDPLVLDLDNRK